MSGFRFTRRTFARTSDEAFAIDRACAIHRYRPSRLTRLKAALRFWGPAIVANAAGMACMVGILAAIVYGLLAQP